MQLQQNVEGNVKYQGKNALSQALSSEHMAKLTVVIFVHHVNGKEGKQVERCSP
jgi:hypothetical protein